MGGNSDFEKYLKYLRLRVRNIQKFVNFVF